MEPNFIMKMGFFDFLICGTGFISWSMRDFRTTQIFISQLLIPGSAAYSRFPSDGQTDGQNYKIKTAL